MNDGYTHKRIYFVNIYIQIISNVILNDDTNALRLLDKYMKREKNNLYWFNYMYKITKFLHAILYTQWKNCKWDKAYNMIVILL